MQKERQIKFRTEHRAGYEEYNWKQEPVSVVMQYIHDVGFTMSVCGVIPPYKALNDILASGECDAGMSGLTVWEPVFLSIDEYNVTKKALINHPENEYFCDEELASISDFEEWNTAIFSKYTSIPIDEDKIILYLEQKRVKGLQRCLTDAHLIFMRRNHNWQRIAHVSKTKIEKIKQLIITYINSGGKYLIGAFAALSEFPEFEKEFRNGLSKYGKKDKELGYYIALFLNRFDKEKYILPYDFYFRINQAIEPNEIDELLKL